ncbi:MAG: hypothetical protein HFG27_09945 [Provencibacterium sp.]|jgi:hypothetical protein|nr:hypothetical protein [Provencibacterium sp.]
MPCKCESVGCCCVCPESAVQAVPAADNPCLSHPCSTESNLAEIAASYYPKPGTDCAPILLGPSSESLRQRERCTDPNGCTGLYPVECRDGFWPSFSHPRWLCCADLYVGQPV